jgi:DNA polymerase I-like protein with 3'-5' exonuclease and polymerase domains
LYGAGSEKIGQIVGKGAREGARLKKRFEESIPAYRLLCEAVESAAKRGHLIGLDGRHLQVRSAHAALNTLLQSAGALVMKKACVILHDLATKAGIRFAFMLNVHDEFQAEVEPDRAEEFGQLAVKSIELAGEHYKFRCPLTGEYHVGRNWSECH